MSRARLSKLALKNFKSYGKTETEIELRPLTLLVGRNNSGKSSVIQALLLLKQTLEQVRGNEPLTLHGAVPVPAGDLREITHGWPEGDAFAGPEIGLEWESWVNIEEALANAGHPKPAELAKLSDIEWAASPPPAVHLRTKIGLRYAAEGRKIVLRELRLSSERIGEPKGKRNPGLTIRSRSDGGRDVVWAGEYSQQRLVVEWDHFLPFLSVDRRNVGPRHSDRGRANGFLILYDQPLADLKGLLSSMAYLSSARPTPQPVYQPVGGGLTDVGISGERAAQVFHARGQDSFHYLPPLSVSEERGVEVPTMVHERRLSEAVSEIFEGLGVPANFTTEDIANIGFTMLFGRASLFHVGRGISYLLPIVELGLLGDPIANKKLGRDVSLEEYTRQISEIRHIALEEPESHLHPRVHSLLAHFFVSTAMSGRQWLIETHSDHMVRRLRRLAAASEPGSALERWLCENVAVLEVTQADATTRIGPAHLTPAGDTAERWPEDFMDRALVEEDVIFMKSISKNQAPSPDEEEVQIEHRDPEEEEVEESS